MNDRKFLTWLHDRLEYVYKEDPMYDFMLKLQSIIEATPVDQCTPNTAVPVLSNAVKQKEIVKEVVDSDRLVESINNLKAELLAHDGDISARVILFKLNSCLYSDYPHHKKGTR